MLSRLRLYLSRHRQAATGSFNQICRRPLSSLVTIIIIAVALALPCLFWVMTGNLQGLTGKWQRAGSISLYLKMNTTHAEEQELLKKLHAMPGVASARIFSAEDGLKLLTRQEGMADIMSYLPENPLPTAIQIIPAITARHSAALDVLYQQLKQLPQVEQARMDMQWVQRLHSVLGFIRYITDSLLVLLAVAVTLIIANTLRLALYRQQEEVSVMKLIGATDAYIIRPFLYSGIWYAVLGAVIAVLLVNIFIYGLGAAVTHWLSFYDMNYPFTGMNPRQILLLLLFSATLGWIGARFSVKRQIHFIEAFN